MQESRVRVGAERRELQYKRAPRIDRLWNRMEWNGMGGSAMDCRCKSARTAGNLEAKALALALAKGKAEARGTQPQKKKKQ